MTATVPLRWLVRCLDGQRVPLNREERSGIPGDYPYWGANGVVDSVGEFLFDEDLVLLGEDGAPFGDRTKDVSFLVSGRVWVNNHIHVLRPLGVEPRFLTYALNTVDWVPLISGSTRDKLTQDDMMQARVPDWPLHVQRAIADYLDAETARIDALIIKKRRFIELLEDRRWSYFLRLVRVANAPVVPLRRALLGITDGPFGSAFSSSEYTDDGIAVVRLGNIGFAEWRGGDLAHLPESRYRDFLRHRVQPGDVLFAGLGDDRNHAGRACVAPEGGRMIVKGKCFCGRINRRRAIPDFLAMFCSSPDGASAIAVEARGSTRTMINLDIIKGVPVPLPSLDQQRSIVHETRSSWAATRSCIDRLDRQLDMLVEHRQALITAAVTGDLEVAA